MADPKLEAAIDAYDAARKQAYGPGTVDLFAVPAIRQQTGAFIGAAIAQYMGMLGEVEFIDAETGQVRRGLYLG